MTTQQLDHTQIIQLFSASNRVFRDIRDLPILGTLGNQIIDDVADLGKMLEQIRPHLVEQETEANENGDIDPAGNGRA